MIKTPEQFIEELNVYLHKIITFCDDNVTPESLAEFILMQIEQFQTEHKQVKDEHS